MAQAKSGDTVRVHYTGKFEDGTVFDSSEKREPLQFTIGEGQIIPGFEDAIIGMNPDEEKTVKILADQAYGPHQEEKVIEVERERLPEELKPEVGQHLEIRQSDGRTIPVIVTKVSEATITIDANHPLAGQDLIFDTRLVEIV